MATRSKAPRGTCNGVDLRREGTCDGAALGREGSCDGAALVGGTCDGTARSGDRPGSRERRGPARSPPPARQGPARGAPARQPPRNKAAPPAPTPGPRPRRRRRRGCERAPAHQLPGPSPARPPHLGAVYLLGAALARGSGASRAERPGAGGASGCWPRRDRRAPGGGTDGGGFIFPGARAAAPTRRPKWDIRYIVGIPRASRDCRRVTLGRGPARRSVRPARRFLVPPPPAARPLSPPRCTLPQRHSLQVGHCP